ncbi:hypothetical protein, partial [Psychrobacter sp.]
LWGSINLLCTVQVYYATTVFALLSFAAVTHYPPWLADDDVWTGSWGYTTARVLWSVAWVLLLLLMTRYTAYMQHRKQYKD